MELHTYRFKISHNNFYDIVAESEEKAREMIENCNDLTDYYCDELYEPQPSIISEGQID